jgi:hypothetical protein
MISPDDGLERLRAEDRAVLQLLLTQRCSYAEIGRTLSIPPAAVRARALSAVDALAPSTQIPLQRRALTIDYLLGQQLPEAAKVQIRRRLSEDPAEREWAGSAWSALALIADGPAPEIPNANDGNPGSNEALEERQPPPPVGAGATSKPPPDKARRPGRSPRRTTAWLPLVRLPAPREPAMLLGAVMIAILIVAVLAVIPGGSTHKPKASAHRTASTSTTASAARVLARIRLTPPSSRSKATGVAEVFAEGTRKGLAIGAQHVPPNTRHPPDAYAVWLYNSPSDTELLGFVNVDVKKNGELTTGGGLRANASRYKYVLLTLETRAHPKAPGKVVLEGPLTGL